MQGRSKDGPADRGRSGRLSSARLYSAMGRSARVQSHHTVANRGTYRVLSGAAGGVRLSSAGSGRRAGTGAGGRGRRRRGTGRGRRRAGRTAAAAAAVTAAGTAVAVDGRRGGSRTDGGGWRRRRLTGLTGRPGRLVARVHVTRAVGGRTRRRALVPVVVARPAAGPQTSAAADNSCRNGTNIVKLQ